MESPRHWRLNAQRYRLEGSTCPICGRLTFPPRPVCTLCTAEPDRLVDLVVPVLRISTGITGVECQVRYRITERTTG